MNLRAGGQQQQLQVGLGGAEGGRKVWQAAGVGRGVRQGLVGFRVYLTLLSWIRRGHLIVIFVLTEEKH